MSRNGDDGYFDLYLDKGYTMIFCTINDRRRRIQICDSVAAGYTFISFDMYYDSRYVRRCLRILSGGLSINENNELRWWSVNIRSDTTVYLQNLIDSMDLHIPLHDRTVYISNTNTRTYLTKGNTQLSICRDSPRRHTNQFLWFESLLNEDGISGEGNSITSDQEFAILEDSICLGSAGADTCSTIDMPSSVRRLSEGSVLA